MSKYDYQKSANLVNRCAPQARTDFYSLAQKENQPDQNLKQTDFAYTPNSALVVDGDNLAKVCSPSLQPCSMDFAFVLDNDSALLGDMKFNVDASIRKQLKKILKKFKGTYNNLHALVSSFHNTSFVLFNEASFEECKRILSNLDEEFQDDDLVSALNLHFKAETLPSFSKKFF